LVLGGLAAGLLAHAEKGPVVPAVALGSAAALLAAKVGHDLRARAAQKLPDPVVAVAEDGLAVSLAAWGTRAAQRADTGLWPIAGGSMAWCPLVDW
jgi:hypothetical protein